MTRALNAMFDEGQNAAKRREEMYEYERKQARKQADKDAVINAVADYGMDIHTPVSFQYSSYVKVFTTINWLEEMDKVTVCNSIWVDGEEIDILEF